MEVLIGLFALGLFLVVVVLPLVAFARLGAQRARLDRLEWELNRLSQHVRDLRRATSPDELDPESAAPTARPAPAPSSPAPVAAAPIPGAPAAPAVVAAVSSASAVAPVSAGAPPATPGPRPAPEPPPLRAPMDAAGLEQLIGGVWLQNLGAVLLLVGVFLMILWGYTSGRFGAEVLVIAGFAMGLGFIWRGDRVARRMPAFGHALIGVGLGILYLTVHMGYVRLHVLPTPLAFALMMTVSVAAMLAGLRYRVQAIAALGVIGAFLPQFLGGWLGLAGFRMPAPALLGYLAGIDLLVFALAARAGWSGLNLSAVVLTALAWAAAYGSAQWGWATQIGLSALFVGLGLAPLPRLVRQDGRVRAMDLAVIAVAPLALVFASFPFLAYASRSSMAMLLLSLAALELVAALWVDSRRPERDLWAPLTGAATLFLTAALERFLGPDHAGLAWSVEGVVLLALGLGSGGGWLRLWGTIVSALGAAVLLARVTTADWDLSMWPGFHPQGLGALGGIAALVVGASLLGRARERLSEQERYLPELWLLMGHGLLFVWLFAESEHVAKRLLGSERAHGPSPIGAGESVSSVRAALAALAWCVQSAGLLASGAGGRSPFARLAGYGVAAFGALALLVALGLDGGWPAGRPVLHASSMASLAAIAVVAIASALLAARRSDLHAIERRAPELGALVAVVALALWGLREGQHLARAMAAMPASSAPVATVDFGRFRTLSAVFTNAAWLAEIVGLLLAGWLRGSAFLRWCALALLGVTLLRFVVVDLQTVDVFWRFLTAIVVGAAMLAMSYAYQRRVRAREDSRPGAPTANPGTEPHA